MSIFSNPVVLCGLIALGIVLILVIAVVICCKKGSYDEREELKLLSEEIEADAVSVSLDSDDGICDVLLKMQEALDVKESVPCSFEQEQEENAIISYKELLDSFGGNSSLNLDAIDLYEDEMENQIEISDFNKEIIDAYQNENLEKEIYNFQNDYSSEPLQFEIANEVNSIMNFDFSEENIEVVDKNNCSEHDNILELKNNVVSDNSYKKFKRTEIISPVYGIINDSFEKSSISEDVEEILFEDDLDPILEQF